MKGMVPAINGRVIETIALDGSKATLGVGAKTLPG
jgi:hypothetical protein